MELVLLKKGTKTVTLIDVDDYEAIKERSWFVNNRGYVAGSINGRYVLLHRVLMGLSHGDKTCVDHINRNKLDNRRSNMRLCTFLENLKNKNTYKNNFAGFKGVDQRDSGNFRARIRVGKKLIQLGSFKTPTEAAMAYDKAAIEYNGEFSGLNFPEGVAG